MNEAAEKVRKLVRHSHSGSLGTISQKHPGYPFVSLMPYAVDRRGSPVFFVSGMAVHSKNMFRESRVSLAVAEGGTGDPLNAARATLLGVVQPAEAVDVSGLYFAQHENAKQWRDFSDFSFLRLEISSIYFVGGFGVMCWITGDEYYSQ